MSKKIDEEKCIGCGACERVCIVGCISKNDNDNKRKIDESACVDCGACLMTCPVKCIS